MIIKTIFMLSILIGPMLVLILVPIESTLLLFGLYILSGLGMAGVGMGVMHDANHGSYSSNRRINKYMSYTMNLLGANATVWKIQHNVLHHTYTNIEEQDEDINVPSILLRVSPHAKRYWIHRFQHMYAWFFYGLSTLSWLLFKDFSSMFRYNNMGFFDKKNFTLEFLKLVAWKIVYITYSLILPIIFVPQAAWLVILAFVAMHFVTGISITIVFQAAHIMPDNEFPLPNKEGIMENDWSVHQVITTTNFSPKSNILSWFIGGLNFQIEHHLLPNICHVHYKKLSAIVAKTAKEYGIPYNNKKTFVSAVWDHLKMLRQLGRCDYVPSPQYVKSNN